VAPASAAKKLYGSCQLKRTFLSSIFLFFFSFLHFLKKKASPKKHMSDHYSENSENTRNLSIGDLYPVLKEKDALIHRIYMAGLGVGVYKDESPILATSGLFQCLGLTGYDASVKAGFLAHIAPSQTPQMVMNRLLTELGAKGVSRAKFDVTLLTPAFANPENVDAIIQKLTGNPLVNRLVIVDFFPNLKTQGAPVEGIALDLRNGQLLTYKPIKS